MRISFLTHTRQQRHVASLTSTASSDACGATGCASYHHTCVISPPPFVGIGCACQGTVRFGVDRLRLASDASESQSMAQRWPLQAVQLRSRRHQVLCQQAICHCMRHGNALVDANRARSSKSDIDRHDIDRHDMALHQIPRWLSGVPATLNLVVPSSKLLMPWPPSMSQDPTQSNSIKNV
jgi:hypothetical protein